MMKTYVITTGQYSDYQIRAVLAGETDKPIEELHQRFHRAIARPYGPRSGYVPCAA